MSSNIKITKRETLSDDYFPLQKVSLETEKKDGSIDSQTHEVYIPANAVTILLYHPENKTVLLIKQFRLATYISGNVTGVLLETCAGLMKVDENPDDSIVREVKEETGYAIKAPVKLFQLYSTPGSVTEKVTYYMAPYTQEDKVAPGGGLANEHEAIELLELPFEEAYQKIQTGEITDAKTVLLLQYARIHLF